MQGAEIKLRFVPPSMGGRIPPSAFSGGSYRPHLRVGATGEYLGVAFLRGPENAGPDSEIDATVALIYDIDYSSLQPGTQFEVLEGATCVATGRVIRRFENDADWRTAGTQSA
jgi:translation elongation factor EF-Tu-like GTPase